MQNVQALVQQVTSGSTSTSNSDAPRSKEETQATNYLFGLLAIVYGEKKMSITFPDEMRVAAKRMYAPLIGKFSREEIDKGVTYVKEQRQKGSAEFEWPNIDRIIGSIKEANRVRALHRPYEKPAALIGHDKEVAKAAGAEALKAMREMF
tara:strand:- start:89 stop:538 length:450 start_codon:yes stop_codon:yes gene_type:complete